jgi:hypothetical protein
MGMAAAAAERSAFLGCQLFQDGRSIEREPLEAPNGLRWTITHDWNEHMGCQFCRGLWRLGGDSFLAGVHGVEYFLARGDAKQLPARGKLCANCDNRQEAPSGGTIFQ